MAGSSPSLRVLFAELRRRRVFRVAAVYGVVGFGILQIVDLAVPALLLPEWVYRLVAFLLLIGLPIAILLAWAFEMSPEGGMRRTPPATEAEIEARATSGPAGPRWLLPGLAMSGVAILVAGAWLASTRGETESAAEIELPAFDDADVRTVAILPFQNVSGREDDAALARGIQQGLLDGLGRVGALRLTSLTSVREYENTTKSLRRIGDELGVRYLVEGSVQKAGDRVQFSVALVDADTDERVWAEQYDRMVHEETLFDVQADVATSVVRALTVRLTPEERTDLETTAGSSDLAARVWYQRALEDAYRGGLDDLMEAEKALNRAVAIDPGYATAWAELVRITGIQRFAYGQPGEPRAKEALERVEALAPGSHLAALGRGYYAYYVEGDFVDARDEFEAALSLYPSNADALTALGLIQRRLGEWQSSTLAFRQAVRLDPRNLLRLQSLYENLTFLGAFAEGDAIIEHALAVEPANPHARAWKVWNVFESRGIEAARRLAAEFGITGEHPSEMEVLVGMAFLDRDYPAALAALAAWDSIPYPSLQAGRLVAKSLALRLMDDEGATVVAESALAILEDAHPAGVKLPVTFHAQALALAGRRADALAELRSAEAEVRGMEDAIADVEMANHVVSLYGLLGEVDAGLELLAEIIDAPGDDTSVFTLERFPLFDSFRSDPRFAELVERRARFEAENSAWAAEHRPWVP